MGGREDVPDRVVQIMATEHFTLQTARAATIAEVNGRQQSYLGVLSATILALAFIAQVTRLNATFFTFALVLLPLVYYLGLATIERVGQIWGEWLLYQIGINRIRRFYLEVDPDLSRYLAPPASGDIGTSLEAIGIPRSRWRWTTGVSGLIGVLNSLVAAVFAGLAAHQAGASPSVVPWLAGALGFAASLFLLRAQMLRAERRTARMTC